MSATKKNLIPKSKAKTAYGLLSDVCRAILAEPKRYNQSWWIFRGEEIADKGFQTPACGTLCCVAGWTAVMKQPRGLEWNNVQDRAKRILGLSNYQGEELFSAFALDSATTAAPQTLAYARAGVRHIRRFQKKYAKQLKAKRV